MSRVCVIGASGVVGMRASVMLLRRRLRVHGFAFRPDSVDALSRLGLHQVGRVDVRDRGTLYKALEGSDIAVNATVSTALDPARSRFVEETASRGAQNIATVCRELGVPLLVSSSNLLDKTRKKTTNATANAAALFVDEDSLGASEGEEREIETLQGRKTRLVQLRFAQTYSGDSPALQGLAKALHEQKAAIIGDGSNGMAMLHADDAAAAIVEVVENLLQNDFPVTPATFHKVYHVCDDAGTTQAEYLSMLASVIGAKPPRRVPVMLARLTGASDQDIAVATAHFETSNGKLKRCAGVFFSLFFFFFFLKCLFSRHFPGLSFKYPTIAHGLAQVHAFWKSVPITKELIKEK